MLFSNHDGRTYSDLDILLLIYYVRANDTITSAGDKVETTTAQNSLSLDYFF